MRLRPPAQADRDAVVRRIVRLAASSALPARWIMDAAPTPAPLDPHRRLSLEIVSHCWQYAPLLRFQLASLVRNPPAALDVRVTVFFSHDDSATEQRLAAFSEHPMSGVEWNWRALPTPQLLRRAIGRNTAALESRADWLWFTDCDVLFGPGCLDTLAEALRAQPAPLLHPSTEHCTRLLSVADIAQAAADTPLICHPNLSFAPHRVSRATGPMQIVRGDVARSTGYCNALPAFQAPARQWGKTHEDRIFRWLLGTQGGGLEIAGVYRIRHLSKGRYRPQTPMTAIRQWVRRAQDRWLRR